MHLLSPYLICGKGPCIGHLGPCGPPSEPPKDKIYPQKEPFVFSRFPRGLGPVILSGNCQMQLFFSQPTSHVARGHVLAIWDPGDPHRIPQTTKFTPETSLYSSTSNCLSKLPNEPFFPNPPQIWQGVMYWPSGTLGTPITVPKQ